MAVVIQSQHTQAGAAVGQRELLGRIFGSVYVHRVGKAVEGGRKIDAQAADVGKTALQIGNVLLRAVDLFGLLADGHFQQQHVEACSGGQCGNDGGIDAAGNADDKAFNARLAGIVVQPADDVFDNGLCLHDFLFRMFVSDGLFDAEAV